ncbi:MAG: AI-2E family transporter, partial [Huintestinicola sp.]
FISGKILDSIIIGIFCFIVMTIFKLDYPVLISTIVGVTNVIPFFGPFIGAIPSALLLLLSGTPKQTFVFIVIVVVLQQIDGNILGPWILGDSTGLPAFWVMFAIFVGGGLFGFAGMLLGVPIFAVIFTLVQEIVETLLKKKGLSVNTEEYYPGPSMIGRRRHKKKKTQPEKKEPAKNS